MFILVPGALLADTDIRTIRVGETTIDVVPKSGREYSVPPGIVSTPSQTDASSDPLRGGFGWTLQSQSAAVFTDLSMADATHGFASAELGQVYRTTNGQTWTQVLNVGFPRYWYGVHAFDPSTVFICGFQNATGQGIGRWSTDGGASWQSELVIDPDDWITICQFADRNRGIATNIGGGGTHMTTNGGGTAGDWLDVLADVTGGWFAGNFTFLPETNDVYLTGISFCRSTNGGATYTRRSSIDSVFDGGVCFVPNPPGATLGAEDPQYGWTGGGQISDPVQGWVHRTTDGGTTWSGRILSPPYPVRAVLFLDSQVGFAVGGNYFQGTGGVWSTVDGGVSWNHDLDSGCEMKGIDWARASSDSVDVWCAGSRSGVGRIYKTRVFFPEGTTSVPESASSSWKLDVAPNPFAESTTIFFERGTGTAMNSVLNIVDASGRSVRRLRIDGTTVSGSVVWDGADDGGEPLPNGIYFLRLDGDGNSVRRGVLRIR